MQPPASTRRGGFVDHYHFGDEIGKGYYATVYKTFRRSDMSLWAVKVIDKRAAHTVQAHLERELRIMTCVDHPNLVKLVDSFQSNSNLFLVMEYVPGGELFTSVSQLGSYCERDASRVMQRIFSALSYLHDKGIVHRDLKPENILLAGEGDITDIKITDFGLSNIIEGDDLLKTPCGTLEYIAPEIITSQRYGPPVDIWSSGVILYLLLCGYPPFYGQNNVEVHSKIVTLNYTFDPDFWSEISDSAKTLIAEIFVLEPENRPTASQLLKHPWVLGQTATNAPLHESVRSLKSQGTFAQSTSQSLTNQFSDEQLRGLMNDSDIDDQDADDLFGANE